MNFISYNTRYNTFLGENPKYLIRLLHRRLLLKSYKEFHEELHREFNETLKGYDGQYINDDILTKIKEKEEDILKVTDGTNIEIIIPIYAKLSNEYMHNPEFNIKTTTKSLLKDYKRVVRLPRELKELDMLLA
ncbi:MAG: hypothetical protein ACRC41_12605 [Sarcina sp.]